MSLRLTRRGTWLLLAALATGGLWALLGLREIGYLAVFLAACLVCAVLTMVPLLPPLRAGSQASRLSFETPTPAVAQTHTVRARLSEWWRPLAAVSARWESPEGEKDTPVQRRAASGPTGAGLPLWRRWTHPGELTTELTVAHRSRGSTPVRLVSLELEDPLGLVRRRRRVGVEGTVLVVPRLLADPRGSVSLAGADGGHTESDAAYAANFGAPGGDIREYRMGDTVRQIHWKQSARQRELVVRLPEKHAAAVADVHLTTSAAAYDSEAAFEHAVSGAATIGVRQLRAGNVVRLHLGGAEPQLCTSVSELMRSLALVRINDARWRAHA